LSTPPAPHHSAEAADARHRSHAAASPPPDARPPIRAVVGRVGPRV